MFKFFKKSEPVKVQMVDELLMETKSRLVNKQGDYNHEADSISEALGFTPERFGDLVGRSTTLKMSCEKRSQALEKLEKLEGYTLREKLFMATLI